MNYKALIVTLIIKTIFAVSLLGNNHESRIIDQMTLRGYLKAMPGLRIDRDFSNPHFDNLMHNRLNFRWSIVSDLNLHIEVRNRLFYNPLIKEFPMLADMLEKDDGLVDMSWIWYHEGAWIGHTEVDRLYLDYRHNNWQFRTGRQRINWGINLVSNPNDLFNTYSFFDFDYEERPGADALRVQYNTGFASRLEAAWSPARESKESVGALLWSFNASGYDFQTIAGYYKNRSALGFGWAGHIGGAGFKGEGSWFYDLEEIPGKERSTLVVATGLDYMFSTGSFALIEFLYNGGYQPLDDGLLLLNQPLRPDNIMFSEYAITMSLQQPFSPVFNGSIAIMALPDQESFFVMPRASWSLMTNLDMDILSQVFLGGSNTIFEQAGSAWYMSFKYSF